MLIDKETGLLKFGTLELINTEFERRVTAYSAIGELSQKEIDNMVLINFDTFDSLDIKDVAIIMNYALQVSANKRVYAILSGVDVDVMTIINQLWNCLRICSKMSVI